MPTPFPPPKNGSHHPDPEKNPVGMFFLLAVLMGCLYLAVWYFVL